MQQYAVFGNPIEHSKSPEIHRRFAEQTQQSMQYKKQLVDVNKFSQAVEQFFVANGKGLNITVPFKLEAHAIAKQLSNRANKAGAVNTLFIQDDELYGDNTDGLGLCCDMQQNFGWQIQGSSILVLGAGGAVRGVLEPLLAQQPKRLIIANRTVSKAQQLSSLFSDEAMAVGCSLASSDFESLSKQHQQFDFIINGTSASLGGELPAIPASLVNHSACYDMMYAKSPTPFLQWAAAQGARSVADGLGMLVEQAAESFYIWRGVRPQTAPVIKWLRDSL